LSSSTEDRNDEHLIDKIPQELKEHVEIKGIYDQVVKYRDAISHRYYAYTPLFETEKVA